MRNYEVIEEFIIGKLERELPLDLFYHRAHHTKDVLRAVELIAADEKISDDDLFLLKVAALYHDSGFLKTYKMHEEASCDLAKTSLPDFGLSDKEIEIICGMIMATKIPPHPKTQLERIISDADLEYLGTDEYERISDSLFEEVKIHLNVGSRREWDEIQLNFLSHHHYFTNFCRKNREPEKQKYLNEIKARLSD